jgi:hypothetical protein
MEIDRVIALDDDLRQKAMREALAPFALRIAGEEAVEVVAVLRG